MQSITTTVGSDKMINKPTGFINESIFQTGISQMKILKAFKKHFHCQNRQGVGYIQKFRGKRGFPNLTNCRTS